MNDRSLSDRNVSPLLGMPHNQATVSATAVA